jgi:myo-inositol-1(or 4)-monophosphatase
MVSIVLWLQWRTKVDTWSRLGASKEEGGAMVHSARALGSAALNLSGVADGSLDIYWEGGCWAWDVCAGWVILTEAGGIIVDGNPGSWDIPVDHRKYLAIRAAPSGQKEIVEEFWGYVEGTMDYES